MSIEEHGPEWYEGHSAGYDAALEDASTWIDNTIDEWYSMKIVTGDQMVSLQQLARAFERYATPSVQPHWIPKEKENAL